MTLPLAPAAWREGRMLLRQYHRPLMLAFVLVVVNRVATLALPAAFKYVIDDVIGRQRLDQLIPLAILTGASVIVEAASALGAAQLAGIAGQRAIADLRRGLHKRVMGLPMPYLEATQTSALAARLVADTDQVRYLVGSGSVQLASSVLTAVLVLAILFWLNAWLTVALVALLATLAAGLLTGFRRLSTALKGTSSRQAAVTGHLVEALAGIRLIKAFVAERREAQRFTRAVHQLLRENARALAGISCFNAASALATGGIGMLVLLVAGRAVAHGTMSVGSLVMYLSLTSLLLSPVVQLAVGAGEFGKAAAALSRIGELRRLATEADEDRRRWRVRRVIGRVAFEDVSYGYQPDHMVLRHVSLEAGPGTITALVGPNGSGKSTLCRLLLAYDTPNAGRILIDGRDLATLRRRDFRYHVGVVLQEDHLFDSTIEYNIRYGRPGASDASLRAAARLASCDGFIERLPHAYSTMLGERGLRLSAGQRQRIAMARALLVDPRVLVLDEATAHLDTESEIRVRDALCALGSGRTMFVITHRLATLRMADQVLVLEGGSIVERGTHEDLVRERGRYWHLMEVERRGLINPLGADMGHPSPSYPAGQIAITE